MSIDFDKLFLVKDSEYGTHVTYVCFYPDDICLDFFSDYVDLSKILEEIEFRISLIKENLELKYRLQKEGIDLGE